MSVMNQRNTRSYSPVFIGIRRAQIATTRLAVEGFDTKRIGDVVRKWITATSTGLRVYRANIIVAAAAASIAVRAVLRIPILTVVAVAGSLSVEPSSYMSYLNSLAAVSTTTWVVSSSWIVSWESCTWIWPGRESFRLCVIRFCSIGRRRASRDVDAVW